MFALLAATVNVDNTLGLRFNSTRGCTYDDYDAKCAPPKAEAGSPEATGVVPLPMAKNWE